MEKKFLPDTIKGLRITLKRQEMGNAPLMFDYVNRDRERLSRFLPWTEFVKTVEDERGFIRQCDENWESHKAAQYAIFSSNGEYMGNIGAFNFNWDHESCEIGYWILGQFEGKGYMSESVALLEEVLFETGFHRIIICCDTENIRSGNVPKRLKYRLEGVMRDCFKNGDHFENHQVYSKLSTEVSLHKKYLS